MMEFFDSRLAIKPDELQSWDIEFGLTCETSQTDYYCNIDTLFVSKKKNKITY